jgi:hypothetical protein
MFFAAFRAAIARRIIVIYFHGIRAWPCSTEFPAFAPDTRLKRLRLLVFGGHDFGSLLHLKQPGIAGPYTLLQRGQIQPVGVAGKNCGVGGRE